jgi:hypothetical protein
MWYREKKIYIWATCYKPDIPLQIGPSGVRALPLGVAEERSVHNIRDYFDPSGVRALPLGVDAEQSVHYIWYYVSFFFLFLSVPHTFLPRVMKLCMAF